MAPSVTESRQVFSDSSRQDAVEADSAPSRASPGKQVLGSGSDTLAHHEIVPATMTLVDAGTGTDRVRAAFK
jgi:hypothetical protein